MTRMLGWILGWACLALHVNGEELLRPFHRIAPGVFAGGTPSGPDAWAFLARQGVTTVVSVDGLPPDATAAKRCGIRPVHIPIGYDGIPLAARAALDHARKTSKGAVFIHCHHGRHRGPAAAVWMARAAGAIGPGRVEPLLATCGTSRDYLGLWRDVIEFEAVPPNRPAPRLPERVEVDSLTRGMADLDRLWDKVKVLRERGWKDEDRTAAIGLAVLVREQFVESARLQDPIVPVWQDDMQLAIRHAKEFEASVRKGEGVEAAFTTVAGDCRSCHRAHRD